MKLFIQYKQQKVPLNIESYEVSVLSTRDVARRAREAVARAAEEEGGGSAGSEVMDRSCALAFKGRVHSESSNPVPLSRLGLSEGAVLQYIPGRRREERTRGSPFSMDSESDEEEDEDDEVEPALHFGTLAHLGFSDDDVVVARTSFYASLADGAARGVATGRPLADALAPRLLLDPSMPQAIARSLSGDEEPVFLNESAAAAMPSLREALAVEDEWFRSEVGEADRDDADDEDTGGWDAAAVTEAGLAFTTHPFGATLAVPPPPHPPHMQLLEFTVPMGTPKHALFGVILGFALVPFSVVSLCSLPLSRLARVGVVLGISLNIFLALMHLLSN
jgi:hypothetical protein